MKIEEIANNTCGLFCIFSSVFHQKRDTFSYFFIKRRVCIYRLYIEICIKHIETNNLSKER